MSTWKKKSFPGGLITLKDQIYWEKHNSQFFPIKAPVNQESRGVASCLVSPYEKQLFLVWVRAHQKTNHATLQ